MTDPCFTYQDGWAKTAEGAVAQRLPTHCRITGSVGRLLAMRDHYVWSSGLPILSACHDVGKLSTPFLAKSAQWMAEFGLSALTERWRRSGIRHECFSQATAADILEARGLPLAAAHILGAHHGRWLPEDLGELDVKEWRAFVKSERRRLVEDLEKEFGVLPSEAFSDIQARYLAGAVSVADWIASNPDFFPYGDDYLSEFRERLAQEAMARIGLIPPAFVPDLTFEGCFGFEPNDMQRSIDNLPLNRGLYLIEADTGSGKTEAALFLAYRLIAAGASRGLYFALPTQLSSNLILRRVQKALRGFSRVSRRVKLCHGSAWLEERHPRSMEGTEDGFAWFSTSRRGLLYPFGAGTIDQVLLSTLKSVRHSSVRTFGLAGKVVIIDEAHSYDRYTGTLVEKLAIQCKELGSTLIILSATLPASTRHRLCAIFEPGSPPLCLNFANSNAPQKRVQLEWTSEVDVIELAIRSAQAGQCVMIVRNTVRLAQATFRAVSAALAGDSVDLGLIHSRFIQRHRRQYERRWTKALGKSGKRPRGCVLVGTQILEQSLDIDADLLISDLCPIDLIIQRLGRLWRHDRSQRSGAPTIHLINPVEPDFGPHGKVYSPYLLARTRETLEANDTLELPAQTRELIESVYGDRDETDPLLQRYKSELDTDVRNAINRANVAADDRVDYDDENAMLTRLIEQETVDVVIHEGSDPIPGGRRLQFGQRSVDVRSADLSGAVGLLLHMHSLKVPFYHLVAEPFEPSLRRYFPGGAKLARLDGVRLEFTNALGSCTYTPEMGFEATT